MRGRSLRTVAVVPGRRRVPGYRGFTQLTSVVVLRLPSICPVCQSLGGDIPDPPAHRVVNWEDHAPGVCHVRQQQLRKVAVRPLVPVDAITQSVLPRMAEVEVEIQHVKAMPHRLC